MNSEAKISIIIAVGGLVALFLAGILVSFQGPNDVQQALRPNVVMTQAVPISPFSPIMVATIDVEAPPAVAIDRNRPDIMCMALNIYHEARGSSLEDRIATGLVVLNRMESENFPDTVCDVVWERSQFSWTNDGRSDIPHNLEAYEAALLLASFIISGAYPDFTYGATHYHTAEIRPYWSDGSLAKVRIGAHVYMETN